MKRLKGCKRAVFLVLGLSFLAVTPAAAQTVGEATEACETTAGPEGLLFAGTYAMVHAPVDFETARTAYPGVELVIPVRDGPGMLAFGIEGETSDADDNQVEFLDANGKVVHQCTVETVAFDPAIHKLAQLQDGDCNLKQAAGLPQLLAGHAQVWEVPRDLSEVSVNDTYIANLATMSARTIYLLGKTPGVVVFVWLEGEPDVTYSANLCPFEVLSVAEALGAAGIANPDICRDANGAMLGLSVGQTAQINLGDYAGDQVDDWEGMIAKETVADVVDYVGIPAGIVIEALAPGSTSVFFFSVTEEGESQSHICELVVE
ncbi:MAG: hypothetical protein B7Z10_05520 [Rhodobacterales bacterium 32-66-7]|nr:MAG: hypothetical protein B7Z31_13480 [Rhodobacterales bacterium 12-65-15]OYX25665.1 MAG: hypothetical protein B7Z10_05520 [Rhodobacterales bacterium 32-66-7]